MHRWLTGTCTVHSKITIHYVCTLNYNNYSTCIIVHDCIYSNIHAHAHAHVHSTCSMPSNSSRTEKAFFTSALRWSFQDSGLLRRTYLHTHTHTTEMYSNKLPKATPPPPPPPHNLPEVVHDVNQARECGLLLGAQLECSAGGVLEALQHLHDCVEEHLQQAVLSHQHATLCTARRIATS